jgi:putative membrane protein
MRKGAGRRRGAKGGPEDPARIDLAPDGEPAEEPSTVKVASAIAEPVLDRELTEEEKPVAGELVHYGFGGFNGALYGALAEVPLLPIRAFNGMLFGATLWLVADEYVVWKLGIRKEEPAFPSMTHAYALASHLVYGLTLETVRRAIRWLA